MLSDPKLFFLETNLKQIYNKFFFFPPLRFPLIGGHRVSHLRCSAGYESSGCEIRRRIEKCFVGFDCFGYKKIKLYIVAKRYA